MVSKEAEKIPHNICGNKIRLILIACEKHQKVFKRRESNPQEIATLAGD